MFVTVWGDVRKRKRNTTVWYTGD